MSSPTPTRSSSATANQLGGGLAGSFLLHAAFLGIFLGWAWLFHTGQNWGNSDANAGSIQATIVSGLPQPPKPIADPNNVLATDTPSIAPAATTPKTVETPHPDDVLIPTKSAKPVKTADQTAPPPPLHPQPTQVNPNKATTGQAAASIPMSSTETHAGTFSIATQDATFGTRFGYYNEQIKRKLESEWYAVMLDPRAQGHRVYITFDVQRDGTPTDIRIAQPSGDATLDQTSLSAVRHVDTFGPLPDAYQGSYVKVTYYFDPPPRP